MRFLAPLSLLQVLVSSTFVMPAVGLAEELAEKTARAAACSAVLDDSKRLNCYDLFFKQRDVKKKQNVSLGHWRINAGTASDDGSARVVIRTPNVTPVMDDQGNLREAHVYAACRSSRVTIWVNFDQPMVVNPQEMPTPVRFDDGAEEIIAMQNSYDWRSLGIWDDLRSKNFLKKLEGAKHFTIRATTKRGRELSVRFDVANLTSALKPLAKACDWKS